MGLSCVAIVAICLWVALNVAFGEHGGMDATWVAVSAISSAVSAIVVVAATTYAYLQVKEARRARATQTILQFHTWYLSEPYKSTRTRLLRGDFDDIASLTPEQASLVEDVVDQFEFLGMLVDRQLLDYEAVAVFYRYSPPRIWRSAAPFVSKMRSEAPGYGRYLEKLAQRYA